MPEGGAELYWKLRRCCGAVTKKSAPRPQLRGFSGVLEAKSWQRQQGGGSRALALAREVCRNSMGWDGREGHKGDWKEEEIKRCSKSVFLWRERRGGGMDRDEEARMMMTAGVPHPSEQA